jgi:hypothetical protein
MIPNGELLPADDPINSLIFDDMHVSSTYRCFLNQPTYGNLPYVASNICIYTSALCRT